ncbi:MAG TPA: hypothetical protein VFQ53_04605 [Kofleriaceae bacterium]|nr:hypothetical protein [Kofleriaceae bacterium]
MEDDYADIYYVDSRNAVTRDHRTQAQPRLPWIRPRPTVVPPTRTVYVPPQQPAIPAGYAQPIGYAQSPLMYPGPYGQSTAATLLGKLTTGQIVEMVAQIFAALQSLPTAPVATRDVETDVANMVIYQSALASHAKRDEQVRTLGGLVARLVG